MNLNFSLGAQVFYYKMKGDYFRYLAEFEKEGRDKVSEESLNAYKAASGAWGAYFIPLWAIACVLT